MMMPLGSKSENGAAEKIELDRHFRRCRRINHRHQFMSGKDAMRV